MEATMTAKMAMAPKSTGPVDLQRKDLPVIRLDQLQLREHAGNDWVVIAPRDVSVEDLEAGELWSAVAQQLRAYDLVRVLAHDGSWWCELLVRYATIGRAMVKVLRTAQLGERILDSDFGVPPGHSIVAGAPDEGWCVVRDVDGVVMAKGCDNGNWTRQIALQWLLNNATLRQTVTRPAKTS